MVAAPDHAGEIRTERAEPRARQAIAMPGEMKSAARSFIYLTVRYGFRGGPRTPRMEREIRGKGVGTSAWRREVEAVRSEDEQKNSEQGDGWNPVQHVGSFDGTFHVLVGVNNVILPRLDSGLWDEIGPESKPGWLRMSSGHATGVMRYPPDPPWHPASAAAGWMMAPVLWSLPAGKEGFVAGIADRSHLPWIDSVRSIYVTFH